MTITANRFYGKYRGKVANNIDPLKQGRLQVIVASILGTDRLSWAMPCVPYAGPQVGFFMLPPMDANVWVEFEGGDICYPIWTGCFWGKGELPSAATLPTQKLIKTDANLFKMDDTPGAGSLQLKVDAPAVSSPLSITLNSKGILLDCSPATMKLALDSIAIKLAASSVQMSASSVNINQGALEVM